MTLAQISTWWHAPLARGWGLTAFIILAIGIGLAIDSVHQQDKDNQTAAKQARASLVASARVIAVDGCNRDFREVKVLRTINRNNKKQIHSDRRRGDITVRQHIRRTAFYDKQLKLLSLPDCRKAWDIITDDPAKVPAIPKPLYKREG